ncbi:hypothetical protein R1flu_004650 [Riccia fluitans]|uniref:Reverse transcriptase Ty1/copia-type domain-containing protein n=1 Tax=Riccia fluitans TaxID=41844 RepID=A0ABD1YRG4_9MARC
MAKFDAVIHLPKTTVVPTRVTTLGILIDGKPTNESKPRKRRGIPHGSKNKKQKASTAIPTNPSMEINLLAISPPVVQVDTNPLTSNHEPSKEVMVFHTAIGIQVLTWEHQATLVDDIFCFNVVVILEDESEEDLQNYVKAKKSKNWKRWQETVASELNSLVKHKVFGPPQEVVENKTIIGNQWVFVRKQNRKGIVTRYKDCLMAQGFMQRPDVDYINTNSPVMDLITYKYLITIAIQHHLHMQLMEVVIAYLYGTIAEDIYMRAPEELEVQEAKKVLSMEFEMKDLVRQLDPNLDWYGPKHVGEPILGLEYLYIVTIGSLDVMNPSGVFALSSGMVKSSSIASSSGIVTPMSSMENLALASSSRMVTSISRTGVLVGYANVRFMSDPSQVCVHQGEHTKHITPKFFFMSKLDGSEIRVERVPSSDNVADIFTKILPPTSHWKFVQMLGLQRCFDFHQGPRGLKMYPTDDDPAASRPVLVVSEGGRTHDEVKLFSREIEIICVGSN